MMCYTDIDSNLVPSPFRTTNRKAFDSSFRKKTNIDSCTDPEVDSGLLSSPQKQSKIQHPPLHETRDEMFFFLAFFLCCFSLHYTHTHTCAVIVYGNGRMICFKSFPEVVAHGASSTRCSACFHFRLNCTRCRFVQFLRHWSS